MVHSFKHLYLTPSISYSSVGLKKGLKPCFVTYVYVYRDKIAKFNKSGFLLCHESKFWDRSLVR